MDVLKRLPEMLSAGESLVIAVIVSKSGSAPRAVGTKMAVRKDASIIGTIGGGLLEAQVRELAAEVFQTGETVLRKYSFTAEEAAKMCMICGGEVEVLLYFVNASDPSNPRLYGQIAETLGSGKRAWLVTEIPCGVPTSRQPQPFAMGSGPPSQPPQAATTSAATGRQSPPKLAPDSDPVAAAIPAGGSESLPAQCLVKSDGTHTGSLDRDAVHAIMPLPGLPQLVSHDGRLFFVEPLCNQGTVFIFGAGHVSQKLAPLTRLVGFRTVILDDRSEFANRERFETADKIVVADSFDEAIASLEIDEESYLVLVTRGHAHDKTVLRQALRSRAGYIGMIGSLRKRDALYEALQKEGFHPGEFARVCSPIGLEIGAETPEEIAVSIVAQLIQARAGKNR
jgi:xanthine dehydrogenase accessory factor